ncbi:MAG: NAD-dependent epimerase/dehydratase family protein [Candidatus Marinimicrobia bacterium]|nr:NAD-dependent epimerase/dehydratase family protein [Candidatus Neomarinimicrobiota bacterium]
MNSAIFEHKEYNFSHILIIGCGDIGARTAQLWQDEQMPVTGVVRSDSSQQDLANMGINTVQFDLDKNEDFDRLPVKNSLIYYLAPPPRSGHVDPRIRRFLDHVQPDAHPVRLIYMSTSGVYGDVQGGRVTESTPPAPDSERGKRRLDAETAVRDWTEKTGTDHIILRVPGIYGPGRIRVEKVINHEPVLREEDAPYSNRIHADDLARICVAAAKKGKPGAIYNTSDGNPSSITRYYQTIAKLLGEDPPPTISMEEAEKVMSPMALSFLQESKRLDNSKMLHELEIKLLYPDADAGLRASLKEMGYIKN